MPNSTFSTQHSTLVAKLSLLILLASVLPVFSWQLPANCQQLVVGIAQDWDSSHVTVTLYEKRQANWVAITAPTTGRLGKNGLAWGLGIHPFANKPHLKKEGDLRAPAGVFAIGDAFGAHRSIKKRPQLRYTQVTTRDLWVEDASSPFYNRHIRLKREPQTAWEKKAQMRQNDYPHSLKLFIGHNAATAHQPATPNAGSAIFFHIWRNAGKSPTAGCTTLSEPQLRLLISKIDPSKNPHYVLLPKAEYARKRSAWRLP